MLEPNAIEIEPNNVNIQQPLFIRNRYFNLADLDMIYDCVNKNFDQGRMSVARSICRKLDWRQANGSLKDRACIDVLLRLERMGLIKVPLPKNKRRTSKGSSNQSSSRCLAQYDFDLLHF